MSAVVSGPSRHVQGSHAPGRCKFPIEQHCSIVHALCHADATRRTVGWHQCLEIYSRVALADAQNAHERVIHRFSCLTTRLRSTLRLVTRTRAPSPHESRWLSVPPGQTSWSPPDFVTCAMPGIARLLPRIASESHL